MARRSLVGIGPAWSTGSPMTFMMRPSVSSPTGTAIGSPVSVTELTADEALGGVHGDGADGVLAEMLGDLEHQTGAVIVGLERVQNGRQMLVELHVDHGARHLDDAAGGLGLALGLAGCRFCHDVLVLCYTASAPEMISISSLVIWAWRVRLYSSV